jgi:hypothetical protein
MWLWEAPAQPAEVVAFARAQRLGEVFVSVPWRGPTAGIRTLTRVLRAAGVRVPCLGGDPEWADVPAKAAAWAERALADGHFDGVHLDIEPWVDDWPVHAEREITGLARAVTAVRAITALPVEVDIPAPHTADRPDLFAEVARRASAVTIMAYRNTAPAILEVSLAAREMAASVGRRYRIGVDTSPPAPPGAPGGSFAGTSRRVLDRELAAVRSALARDPWFAGTSVHDYFWWRQLAA